MAITIDARTEPMIATTVLRPTVPWAPKITMPM